MQITEQVNSLHKETIQKTGHWPGLHKRSTDEKCKEPGVVGGGQDSKINSNKDSMQFLVGICLKVGGKNTIKTNLGDN